MENENKTSVFESSRARVHRRYGVGAEGGSDALESAADYLITHADNIGKDEKVLKKELREMRHTLKLLQDGAIKGSDAKRKEVIEQYKVAIAATEKTSSALKAGIENLGKSVVEHMPAVDQVIGALTVANPAAGLAVNVVKSMFINSRARKAAIKEERQATLQKIKEEKEAALQKQVAAIEEEKAAEIKKKEAVERMNAGKKHKKEMLDRLDNIHAANLKMLEIWDESDNGDGQLLEAANDEAEKTEQIVRLLEDEKSDREQDKMTQMESDRESGNGNLVNSSDNDDEKPEEKGGFFASFGKGFGRMFKGIFGLLGFLGKIAKFGLKFAGVAGLVYGAFEGFTNAAEILGKSEDSLTLADRLGAAVGNIVGWFADLFDMILGLFGIQTNYGDKVKRSVGLFFADIFTKVGEWITNFFTPILEYFQENSLAEIGGDVYGMLASIPMRIMESVTSLIGDLFNSMGLENVGEIFKNISENFGGGADIISEVISDIATSALQAIADAGGWLGKKVYEWFTDEGGDKQDAQAQKAWEDGQTPSQRFVTSSVDGRTLDAQNASQARTGGDTNVVAPTTNNSTVNNNYGTGRSSANQESVFSTLANSNAMYAM